MRSAFFADLDEAEPASAPTGKKGSSFFADIPERSNIEKTARAGAQYGLGAADLAMFPLTLQSQVLESPGAQHAEYRKHLFEDIERLAEQKATGVWDEQDEKLFKSLQDQIRHPENAEQFVKTANVSPSGIARQGVKKATGYDLEPEGTGEKIAELLGGFRADKLVTGGLKRAGHLATKEGRAAHKLQSQWKALEKSAKGNPLKEDIMGFAKQHKLTPEETTLLLQSKADIDVIGKIAKKSKRFRGIAQGLHDKLQSSYRELKELGSKGGHVNLQQADKLTGKLSDVLTEIKKTYVEGPDTKSAKELIEKTIENINNKPGTIEDLINSRRNLRQFGNWNNLNEGSAIRGKAERAFLEAIKDKNPEIASKLAQTDKAWAQYKKFEKLLSKIEHVNTWHGIPVNTALGAVAFAGAGLIGHLPAALKFYALKEGVQRLSTRLLTDPKFQGIHKRILEAISSGSQKKQQGVLIALEKILRKEDPELYEEFKNLEDRDNKE
jgi:hypothetical protein